MRVMEESRESFCNMIKYSWKEFLCLIQRVKQKCEENEREAAQSTSFDTIGLKRELLLQYTWKDPISLFGTI